MGKLIRPARVGAGVFGIGVDESTVIAAAQRNYEYHLCECLKPEPYNPVGVCAPMMPKGWCVACGKEIKV